MGGAQNKEKVFIIRNLKFFSFKLSEILKESNFHYLCIFFLLIFIILFCFNATLVFPCCQKCQQYWTNFAIVSNLQGGGVLISSYDEVISAVDFFDQRDPSTVISTEEMCGSQWALCWKINLIWSHSIRASLSAYELFSSPSYYTYSDCSPEGRQIFNPMFKGICDFP